MQGLGLRKFTESGWADSSHGRMHVGEGRRVITDTPEQGAKQNKRGLWGRIFGKWHSRENPFFGCRKLWSPKADGLEGLIAGKRRMLSGFTPWPRRHQADGPVDLPSEVDSESDHETSVRAMEALRELDEDFNIDGTLLMEQAFAGGEEELHDSRLENEAVSETMRGLLGTSTKRMVVMGDKCWWSPKGTGCKEYYESFTLPDGTVVPGGDASSGAAGGPNKATLGAFHSSCVGFIHSSKLGC